MFRHVVFSVLFALREVSVAAAGQGRRNYHCERPSNIDNTQSALLLNDQGVIASDLSVHGIRDYVAQVQVNVVHNRLVDIGICVHALFRNAEPIVCISARRAVVVCYDGI